MDQHFFHELVEEMKREEVRGRGGDKFGFLMSQVIVFFQHLMSSCLLAGRGLRTHHNWHELSGGTHATTATNFINNIDKKGQATAGYNLLSTCCGLDILCPCCSQFTIFLPSIRGYGEPPEENNVLEYIKTSISSKINTMS